MDATQQRERLIDAHVAQSTRRVGLSHGVVTDPPCSPLPPSTDDLSAHCAIARALDDIAAHGTLVAPRRAFRSTALAMQAVLSSHHRHIVIAVCGRRQTRHTIERVKLYLDALDIEMTNVTNDSVCFGERTIMAVPYQDAAQHLGAFFMCDDIEFAGKNKLDAMRESGTLTYATHCGPWAR